MHSHAHTNYHNETEDEFLFIAYGKDDPDAIRKLLDHLRVLQESLRQGIMDLEDMLNGDD